MRVSVIFHLRFYLCNKPVCHLQLHEDVVYVHRDSCYAFLDTDRFSCQPDQEVSVLYPELPPAPFPHLLTKLVLVETSNFVGCCVVPEDPTGRS